MSNELIGIVLLGLIVFVIVGLVIVAGFTSWMD